MIGTMNDPNAYDRFISITADGGNIGTLSWKNTGTGWTVETWDRANGAMHYFVEVLTEWGTFRWTTPKWATIRITRDVARYTFTSWDEPTQPWPD